MKALRCLELKTIKSQSYWELTTNAEFKHCNNCGISLKEHSYYCKEKDLAFCKKCNMNLLPCETPTEFEDHTHYCVIQILKQNKGDE